MKKKVKTRKFKDGEEIIHRTYGKGKFVGYVGYDGPMSCRVQFESGEVIDFSPRKLTLNIMP